MALLSSLFSVSLSDHQTRYSRCADNGFLEECISAGGERTTESRKCEAAAVACKFLAASTVTIEDIDISRKRTIGATASPATHFRGGGRGGEAGTNLTPHVPDYSGPTATLEEGWHRQLFGRGKLTSSNG